MSWKKSKHNLSPLLPSHSPHFFLQFTFIQSFSQLSIEYLLHSALSLQMAGIENKEVKISLNFALLYLVASLKAAIFDVIGPSHFAPKFIWRHALRTNKLGYGVFQIYLRRQNWHFLGQFNCTHASLHWFLE